MIRFYLIFSLVLGSTVGVRINFTNCQHPEWSCTNNVPNEIVYTCSNLRSNDHIIYLKDYYTDHITGLTVQHCKDLKVVLDCPVLQKHSQLQSFTVKNSDRLEFISIANSLQTPSEFSLENVNEIVALPRRIFKSPSTDTERKCLGTNSLRKIRITNSKINVIQTRAIQNVTDIKSITFENVTIANIQTQGIEAIMNSGNTIFKVTDSSIENIDVNGITVQASSVQLTKNSIGAVTSSSVNITSDNLLVTENRFKLIYANGLTLKSVVTNIQRNDINVLKTNAMNNVKCARKRATKKQFNFSNNNIANVETQSLTFDYASCKSAGAAVTYANNNIDCRCQNIAFLNNANELNNIIMDTENNNTCLSAPCFLPVDVLKILLENDMCRQNVEQQLMCMLYYDSHSNIEVTSNEDVTEPTPTFYLIRQANAPNSDDGVAAMTAVNKDDLLNLSLNITNRTIIQVKFDSTRDFVETLRSTGRSNKNSTDVTKTPEEYINRCVGPQCRKNVAYDRQKALDFYKYVYAQLRSPRPNDNKKKKN